jgi:hypothetical protein
MAVGLPKKLDFIEMEANIPDGFYLIAVEDVTKLKAMTFLIQSFLSNGKNVSTSSAEKIVNDINQIISNLDKAESNKDY